MSSRKGKHYEENVIWIIGIFLIMSTNITAFASTSETLLQNDIYFDLENHSAQEQKINLANGEEAIIGLEYIPRPVVYGDHGNYELSDGTWKIYWYTAVVNCQYYIDISNSKIVDAYEPWYLCVGVSATGHDLTYTSTKASLFVTFQTPIWDLVSWNGYLNARIEGNRLITSVI